MKSHGNPVRNWDIFCAIIDNFGDIGVTWRLAQQLRWEYGQNVRLWVDKLASARPLLPNLQPDQDIQEYQGVVLCQWNRAFGKEFTVGDIVIEAFACDLPDTYLTAMAACKPPPLWFNLEYLSAEPWIEEYHGLSSRHPRLGMTKYFFFPGFTERTGGLIAERGLLERVRRWQQRHPNDLSTLNISLFSYPNPALSELLTAWSEGERRVLCQVPQGLIVANIANILGRPLVAGDQITEGKLTIKIIPFTNQKNYDHLLWSSHINFVRGEDSFVRAQWAQRPFVWHIYPQQEGAHRVKLEAFLTRYCAALAPEVSQSVRALFDGWNNHTQAVGAAWRNFEAHLPTLIPHAQHWAHHLLHHRDLVFHLVQQVEKQLK